MERILLSPSEVAHVLGIGRTRAYALIGDGTIPSIKIGVSVRVPVAALEEWISKRSNGRG